MRNASNLPMRDHTFTSFKTSINIAKSGISQGFFNFQSGAGGERIYCSWDKQLIYCTYISGQGSAWCYYYFIQGLNEGKYGIWAM